MTVDRLYRTWYVTGKEVKVAEDIDGRYSRLLRDLFGPGALREIADAPDLRARVERMLAGLTAEEERVIRLRYGLPASGSDRLREVESDDETRERIRAIESKALPRSGGKKSIQ